MKKIVSGILFFMFFFGLVWLLFPGPNEASCNRQDDFLKLKINGLVLKKYIDKEQHSYPIIEVKDFDSDSVIVINLVCDKSDAFSKINVMDSLIKPTGVNSIFRNINNKLVMIAVVDFGCRRN